MQKEPGYHITVDRGTGDPVLIVRHAIPPHDVVERVTFHSREKMREVGEALVEVADAMDTAERLIKSD